MAGKGTALTVPVATSRQASTPCHSGVTQATGCIQPGSCSIGKKVPEKSINGVTTQRNRMLKPLSPSCRAVNAKIGVAKAIPVRIAIGRQNTAATDRNPPNSAATPMKIVVAVVRWAATARKWPRSTSRTVIGDASIAW